MHQETLDLLNKRRSVKADNMAGPGPSPEALQQFLTIAARVPDHKKLAPWRFVVFSGEAREQFGQIIADVCEREEKDPPSPFRLETERKRFLRAPIVVAVISRISPKPGVPEWEQILSAGAACMNLCIAANAGGFVTNWLTEWLAYSQGIAQALGLADNERVAGFVYIGSASETPEDRDRPDMTQIVSHWQHGATN